jgi:hypothetical protein
LRKSAATGASPTRSDRTAALQRRKPPKAPSSPQRRRERAGRPRRLGKISVSPVLSRKPPKTPSSPQRRGERAGRPRRLGKISVSPVLPPVLPVSGSSRSHDVAGKPLSGGALGRTSRAGNPTRVQRGSFDGKRAGGFVREQVSNHATMLWLTRCAAVAGVDAVSPRFVCQRFSVFLMV